MNADKKFGVLIGLVLIFIFVFVIGKLPDLQTENEGTEPAQTLMGPQVDPHGLAARERLAHELVDRVPREVEPAPTAYTPPQTESSDSSAAVRIILPLPETQGPLVQPVQGPEFEDPFPQEAAPQILPQPAWPKVHTVASGDNLALIAKHYYGPIEGNRIGTIKKLFEANRRVLHKPDQLQVGQKLVIPPLNPLASKALEAVTVPFGGIGESRLTEEAVQPTPQPEAQWYVVRDGDSLWKIAAAELGNGGRYTEIAKLNAAAIRDEDNLPVGLRLKLPLL